MKINLFDVIFIEIIMWLVVIDFSIFSIDVVFFEFELVSGFRFVGGFEFYLEFYNLSFKKLRGEFNWGRRRRRIVDRFGGRGE